MSNAGLQPIDVLHVVNGDAYAGAERVQELLAARLPAFGYRVRFACLKQGQFQQALEGGPHPSFSTPMRSRFDLVLHARSIARYAATHDCRLIHTHTPRSALVGALASRLAGLPMVHHVHSPTIRDSANAVRNRVNTLAERAAVRRAAKLVAVSRSLADHLRADCFPSARITVVPNGVAVSDRSRSDAARGELTGLTAGVVAWFRPRKGIEVLLEALACLMRDGCPVRLHAVGSFETPEYEATVRDLASALGVEGLVTWRGFQQDVAAELARVDLLALPSLYGEGMPMVVLEAMAMGLPVVATRVEGVPEVVRDGQDGLLVPPGDAAALAGALRRLAQDRDALAAMGASGRSRQREEFSDLAMASRLARIYDGVLGRVVSDAVQQARATPA